MTAELGGADEPGIRASLRTAVRSRRKASIGYQKADAEAPTLRIVCPYATVFVSGAWYLVARCEDTASLRFFRTDRIQSVEVLEQTFRRPAGFVAEELVQNGRAFVADGAGSVTVRYGPRIARWIAEREGAAVAGRVAHADPSPGRCRLGGTPRLPQYGPDARYWHCWRSARRCVCG